MPTDTDTGFDFKEAVAALCPDGPPRVWSLIVTVLGDLGSDVEIGAAPLARILETVGINGAAMRVALHRLKQDEWITARREGRSSAYQLHPARLAESQEASARIYATKPGPQNWHLRLLAPDALVTEGVMVLAPRLILVAGTPSAPGSDLLLSAENPPPDWLREKLTPPALSKAYADLNHGLTIANHLTQSQELSLVEAMALRMLVVHGWRRVILRHDPLPDALYAPGWKGAECRALVRTLLERLPRPDVAALSDL